MELNDSEMRALLELIGAPPQTTPLQKMCDEAGVDYVLVLDWLRGEVERRRAQVDA